LSDEFDLSASNNSVATPTPILFATLVRMKQNNCVTAEIKGMQLIIYQVL
jgi:hypothetical protein